MKWFLRPFVVTDAPVLVRFPCSYGAMAPASLNIVKTKTTDDQHVCSSSFVDGSHISMEGTLRANRFRTKRMTKRSIQKSVQSATKAVAGGVRVGLTSCEVMEETSSSCESKSNGKVERAVH